MKISEASLKRLTQIYRTLSRMIRFDQSDESVSSAQLGDLIGVPSHTIRKDISCLGEIGSSGRGYDVVKLHGFLASELGLATPKKAAVIGIGKIGSALIEYGRFGNSGFDVVAGFDSDVNRIEAKKSEVPLYPAYDIEEIVRREKIELAFLTVTADGAVRSLERLIRGGVKGVVNFSPLILKSDEIHIRNVDLTGELTLLSAMINFGGLTVADE